MNDEPEIGTAISRWIAHLVMPLNQTRSIRNATFLLGRHRRREEEDFCADLLRFEFSALDQTALLPEVRGFRHGEVPHDQPFQLRQTPLDQLGIHRPNNWILSEDELALHD